jgi:gluconokinase
MSTVVDDIAECPDAESDIAFRSPDSRMPILLALDIGSSGVRAALFDESGCAIPGTAAQRVYGDSQRDLATFDADALLEEVSQTIDAVFADPRYSRARIELIALSCFWHSLLGVDDAGLATTPVFSWADLRAADATFELRAEFDETVTHARTGCRFHPSYWPAKLRRLRNDEPQTFSKTRRWLSFADYVAFQLFGCYTTGVSIASGSGLFNLQTGDWDDELLAASGIARECLPAISDRPIAVSAATRWPQLTNAYVVRPRVTAPLTASGPVVTQPNKLALMIGTSGAMRVSFAGEAPAQLPPGIMVLSREPRARRDWRRVVRRRRPHSFIKTIAMVRRIVERPGISGARTRRSRPDDSPVLGRGAKHWLEPACTRRHVWIVCEYQTIEIVRAAMEAIAYRFALIFSRLEPFAPGAEVFASGNALRQSPVWIQILADVLGRRLTLPAVAEASMQGAALLALEAAGKIQSIEKFSVPIETVFERNMTRHAIYREGLERQQKLYEQLYGE